MKVGMIVTVAQTAVKRKNVKFLQHSGMKTEPNL